MTDLYVVIVAGNKTYPLPREIAEQIAETCNGVVVKAQEEDLIVLNNIKQDKEF